MMFKVFAFLMAMLCVVGASATGASAAVTIFYVSTTGNNSNPCTLTQPCRSLQYAINRVPLGGEVHILDSGFYGNNAKIKKSITIVGNGHTISLGVPIIIDEANANVSIKKLRLAGGGAVDVGIKVNSGMLVHLHNVDIDGFTEAGVWTENALSVRVHFTDSLVRNNKIGMALSGSATEFLIIERTTVIANNTGIFVLVGQAILSGATVMSNGTGIENNAQVFTRKNNIVSGNGTDIKGSGSVTTFPAF